MKDEKAKALRRMSRSELLELLLARTGECEQLQEHLTQSQHALERARLRLNDRTIALQEAGSMAEAALRIHHVFEDAQQAAEDYLSGMERLRQEQEQQCADRIAEATQQAEEIIAQAKRQSAQMEQDAQARCTALLDAARQDADRNWEEMHRRLEQISSDNAALREALAGAKKRKCL